MFEKPTNPDLAAERLRALSAREGGKHRADQLPTLVIATTSGGDPPGRLGRLLRRRLPAPLPPRRRVLAAGVLAGVALAVALTLWWERPAVEPPPDLPMAAAAVSTLPETLVVNVVGEVPAPGLITVTSGARVADAVQAAGGPNPGTNLHGLNLARRLTDGEQIAVGVPPTNPEQSQTQPINLNTATKEQLDQLPGIGPVTAQRIIDRRHKRGPFTSVQQLGEIEGIGDTKLAKLAQQLTV